jgi:hypothetical protein
MALASMASLYLNQKTWDDAQQWYEKLIAADPSNADAYYSLGFAAWSKWFPGYQAARASAGLKPDDQGPIPDQAVKHHLRSRWDSVVEDGIANLQKTLELNPRYEDAMSYISLLMRERADLRDPKEEWASGHCAGQWLQKRETKKAGGGAGFSPLEGLPQYGVTLSGSPENPVIESHSGRTVIGYVVETADANGRGVTYPQLIAISVEPAGLPDGGAVYARSAVPVNSTGRMQNPAQVRSLGQGPIVRAILSSVVFADGQFVGIDGPGGFEEFVKKIKAITEAGKLANNAAWDQVEAFAKFTLGPPANGEEPLPFSLRRRAASRLVETRRLKGDAATTQLAEIYSSLPTLWKFSDLMTSVSGCCAYGSTSTRSDTSARLMIVSSVQLRSIGDFAFPSLSQSRPSPHRNKM